MKFYRYWGWMPRLTRWSSDDGNFGWIWGTVGVCVYVAPSIGCWLNKHY